MELEEFSLSHSFFPLLARSFYAWKERKYAWKKGHAWKRIALCRDRWKDGKRSPEGFNVLYILLSLPSVRESVASRDSGVGHYWGWGGD